MPKRKILEHGWRWKLAQTALRLIYGRKEHYISPWRGVGLAASCVFYCNGKILFNQRGPNIEYAGKFGLVGGFMDNKKQETLGDMLAREALEEVNLTVSAEDFPPTEVKLAAITHGRDFIERANYTVCCCYFWHELQPAQITNLQPLDETEAVVWRTPAEVEEMIANGDIPAPDTQKALKAFIAAKVIG